MAAIPSSVPNPATRPSPKPNQPADGFLKYLRAVKTHAEIWFRDRDAADQEECISEAIAAAFVNYTSACRRGRSAAIRPSMLARYAIQHVNACRHVGGSQETKTDVLSRRAQQAHGFEVQSLPDDAVYDFNVLKVPDQKVWRLNLLHDRSTPVADQAAFRIDWSRFLARQHDRTRTAMALLAAGDRRCEVAEKLGVTNAAITQRMARVEKEWLAYQGEGDGNPPTCESASVLACHPLRLRRPSRSANEPRTAA